MAKRKRSKNKKRIWLYVLITFLVIALTGVIYFILYSDFLNVSKMELNESIFYERSDFISDLRTHIISSNSWLGYFDKGSILFWYFSPLVIENPQSLPFAESIDIDVNLPLKSVKIQSYENSFQGVICKDERNCYAFNKEGIIYSKSPYIEGFLILKVQDKSDRSLVLGQHFIPEEEWMDKMFETINILKENNIHFRHAFIEDIELQEWGVELESGTDIYFSFEFITEDLGQVITNFLSQPENEASEYIDFRIPGRIYYK